LELISQVGFENQAQALQVVNTGCAKSIIDAIDSPKSSALQKEIAINIVTNLTSAAPAAIAEAGGIAVVLGLLTSPDAAMVITALKALRSMCVTSEIKTTICQGKTAKYVKLLSGKQEDVATEALALLECALYSDALKSEFEEKRGTKAVMDLLSDSCSTTLFGWALKVLANVGFQSQALRDSFLRLSCWRRILKCLSTGADDLLLPSLSIVHSLGASVNPTLRREGGITSLVSLLSSHDIAVLELSLTILTDFVVNDSNAELVCDEKGLPMVLKLLGHKDERIALRALTALQGMIGVDAVRNELLKSGGVSHVVRQLPSTNSVMRKSAISVVSSLAEASTTMQKELGRQGCISVLAKLFTTGRPELVIAPLQHLSKLQENQFRMVEAELPKLLMRHVRTKDNKLLNSILSVLVNLTSSNLTVVRKIQSFRAVPIACQLLMDTTSKVKQRTTQLIAELVTNSMRFLSNMSIAGGVRRYLRTKTNVYDSLKLLRNAPQKDVQAAAEVAIQRISFYSNQWDEPQPAPSAAHRAAVAAALKEERPIAEAMPRHLEEQLPSISAKQELFELADKLIQQHAKRYVIAEAEDLSSQHKKQIEHLRSEIDEAAEEHKAVKDEFDSIQEEFQMLRDEQEAITLEIDALEEQADEALADEIAEKVEEFTQNQVIEQELSDMVHDCEENYKKLAERLATVTATNQAKIAELEKSLGGATPAGEAASKKQLDMTANRRRIAAQLRISEELLVADLQDLEQHVVEELKTIDCPDISDSAKESLFGVLSRMLTSHMQLSDCLRVRLDAEHADISFGDLYARVADSMQEYVRYSGQLQSSMDLLKQLRDHYAATVVLESLEANCKRPILFYMLRPLQHLLWCVFLVQAMLKNTESTHIDNRLLRTANRKMNVLREGLISGVDNTASSKSSHGALDRYQALLTLLSASNFAFCDVIAECSEAESLVKPMIRVFASQGISSLFLKHQITKEVTETVGDSTLFRSNNMAAQCLSAFAHHVGSGYLKSAVKQFLLSMYDDKSLNLEVNPAMLGLPEDDPKVLEQQAKLIAKCSEAFRFINGSAGQCPVALKNVCYSLRETVKTRFPNSSLISVGGLFFLRFVCPCFVAPERFHIVAAGEIDKQQRRNTILVSKALQNLSNNLPFGKKEPFMIPINEFITSHLDKMQGLQDRLSSKFDAYGEPTGIVDENDLYEVHSNLVNMQNAVRKKIEAAGQEEMLEQFNEILSKLGEPMPPADVGVLQTDASDAPSRRSTKLFKMIRKRTVSRAVLPIAGAEAEEASQKIVVDYKPLVNLLAHTDFAVAGIIWDQCTTKEADVINKLYVKLFDSLDCSVQCVEYFIRQEVEGSLHESTLFRSNSIAPKYVSEFAQFIGRDYLTSTVRPLINKICDSDVLMELNPTRLNGDEAAAKAGCENLLIACREWFDYIAGTADDCPIQIRQACSFLKKYVGAKFPGSTLISVGGLFFLRFVCPVIVAPERLQLVEGSLNSTQRRNLVLISKVLQNLSNDVSFGAKEPFMQPMNEFISSYRSKMMALQERLAEVPMHKLQEIANRELPSFDETQLSAVHDQVYKHKDKILAEIEEMETKGTVTASVPLSDCFYAVAMQMGLPASARKKQLEEAAAAQEGST